MRNLRLDICYDGSRYRGWQRLPGREDTIQGKLEQTLSGILNEPIEISGSGRTDSGVHALGQVANFHCQSRMPCVEILSKLRQYLPEDIGIYDCREVSERFHARLNARKKTYRYRLWNSETPCVFDRKYVALEPRPLDLNRMRSAAEYFLGSHDFSAFCARKNKKKSNIRTIESFSVTREGNEIRFTVTGDGFLYHMVRILVGTLVEVGLGLRDPASIPALFKAERAEAGIMMPARGLCLMEVFY